MKRLIAYMMVAISLFSASTVPGFAAKTDPSESTIMPFYAYTDSVAVSLKISSSGRATAKVEVAGYPTMTTHIYITMYLERKESGKWVTIESWSDNVESDSLTLEESVVVQSGYSYRVRTSCYSYSGTEHEHITKCSQEVNY